MPIPLLAIAAGAQALSTVMGGVANRGANKAAQLGAKIEGEMALLRGTQIGERSREDLATMLGNIDAIRTARGASLDSATGQAIERRTIRDAYRDEGVAVLGELMRQGAANQAARGYGTAARWAIPLSVLNAVPSAMQARSYATMPRAA